MSKRSDELYLGHMRDTARRIRDRVAGKSRLDFDTNEDLQIILTHLVQMIGEAARKVPAETKAAYPQIPWSRIIGMRHKIVHDYMHVDPEVLWETVTNRIPELIALLERITPPEPPSV